MKNKNADDKDYNLDISNMYYLYKEHPELFANTVESNAEFIVRDLRDIPNKPADYLLLEKSPADYKMLFKINSDLKSASLVRFIEGDIIHDGIDGGIDVDIPETIVELPVTHIATGAFFECKNVTRVFIPNSVTTIGEKAFSYSGIQWALIPHSVKDIGPQAFECCFSLKQIYLSQSLEEIKHHTFCNCDKLEGIIIPDNITIIEDYAFSNCKLINMVILPQSLKEIGFFTFYNCKNIKNIDIPDSVTSIGESAFYGCNSIMLNITNESSIEWKEDPNRLKSYEDITSNLLDENRVNPEDPEAVRHILDVIYSNICSDFRDGFDLRRSLNDMLLSAILNNDVLFFCSDFGFLKYIHIYNHANSNSNARIDLYIDCAKWRITNNKNELTIDEHNTIFDDMSLLYLVGMSLGIMGLDTIEASNSMSNVVLNPLYYSIVTPVGILGQNKYRLSPFLESFGGRIKDRINQIQGYLNELVSYKSITNYFYLTSPLANDYSYVLFANIGLDSRGINKECIIAFIQEFKNFVNNLSSTITTGINDFQKRERAVAPAISVVMNRNLRHNYGSHVLSYLCEDNIYEKLSDDVIKKSLTNYISNENDNVFKDGKNLQLPYFIRYLKNRIDYISEITLDSSNILTTRFIYKDVILGIDRVRVLLNYISGVSNFKYKFKTLYNGRPLSSDNDIAAAFPNDIIGICAIWNICENIVRNTSKHAKINVQQEITITLDFSDCKECPGYYKVEIDNGVLEESTDELVENMNIKINDSVLDKDSFELRDKNLGLVEMSVAAAYLRSLDLSCIDSYEYRFDKGQELYNDRGNLIIFKAINKNGALGYRFFIQKPKEFLFIGDWNINTDRQKDLLNFGIMFINEIEFSKSMNNEVSYPHQFVIYQDNVSNNTASLLSDDNDCKTLLPLRKLRVSSDEVIKISQIINNNDNNIVASLNEFAWEHYYKNTDDVLIGMCVNPKKTNDYDQIVFLNHAKKESHNGSVRLKTENHKLWVENLSSYTESKLPHYAEFAHQHEGKKETPLRAYLNNINNNRQIKGELLEAYNCKVIVLDERIQKYSRNNTEGSIPCSDLYSSTNVLIPEEQLDPTTFDYKSIKAIECFINKNITDACLLIHYGLLERIYKDKNTITNILVDWSNKAKRVVVTSGRGSHSLPLPPSVCFTNLSSVLAAFCYNRNKLLINNILYQSRRKHE